MVHGQSSEIKAAASNPNSKAIRLLISFGNTAPTFIQPLGQPSRRFASSRSRWAIRSCFKRIHITKGALVMPRGLGDALLCETVNGPQRAHNGKTQPEVSHHNANDRCLERYTRVTQEQQLLSSVKTTLGI